MGRRAAHREMLAHVETASWKPAIDGVYALQEIQAAARRLDARDRFGKVVLSIG